MVRYIPPAAPRRLCKFSWLLGFGTAICLGILPLARAGYKLGFANLAADARDVLFFWRGKEERILPVPQELLPELTRLGAVFEKAGEPIPQRRHDNLLVRPDAELESVLRPGVRLRAFIMRPDDPVNLNPPTVFLPADAALSPALATWLTARVQVSYHCTTDSAGMRRTLPAVHAARRILIIGDSVAFGMGVDDEHTVASALQRRLESAAQVLNAGVGGYNGLRAARYARRLVAQGEQYDAAIYIACQNDFMGRAGGGDWNSAAEKTMREIAALKPFFRERVAVVLHTYLEYCGRDFFQRKGWPPEWMAKTDSLRAILPRLCRDQGVEYADWTELAAAEVARAKTLFAIFGLYVDHCHLSPRGNDLLAAHLAEVCARWGMPQLPSTARQAE